jgi:hypothetical protein
VQRRGKPIAPIEELLVGQAQRPVDDRFAAAVERPGTTGELEQG